MEAIQKRAKNDGDNVRSEGDITGGMCFSRPNAWNLVLYKLLHGRLFVSWIFIHPSISHWSMQFSIRMNLLELNIFSKILVNSSVVPTLLGLKPNSADDLCSKSDADFINTQISTFLLNCKPFHLDTTYEGVANFLYIEKKRIMGQ